MAALACMKERKEDAPGSENVDESCALFRRASEPADQQAAGPGPERKAQERVEALVSSGPPAVALVADTVRARHGEASEQESAEGERPDLVAVAGSEESMRLSPGRLASGVRGAAGRMSEPVDRRREKAREERPRARTKTD